LTPFGLANLDKLAWPFHLHILARECIVLVKAIKSETLSNYSAVLLRFMQFFNYISIPKEVCMPMPEWLLSHFIKNRGARSVGGRAMKTWLLGLELCHIINYAPWHGTGHLKHTAQGVHKCTLFFNPCQM